MKHHKTLTIVGVTLAGLLSLGANCQKVGDSLSRGNLGGLTSGNQVTDTAIREGVGFSGTLLETGSVKDQETMGESIAARLASSPGLVDDEALNDYVTKVGLVVASVCGRSDLDFTFGILAGSEVNAISAPRGFVFVTREALLRMQDESELAAVLAHEIAHVVEDHGIEAIQSSKALSAGRRVGESAINNSTVVSVLGNVSDDYVKGVLYNKNQETEADKLAVTYLGKAGYDATALARFIERTTTSGQFHSHPSVGNRVATLNAAARAYPGGQKLADRFAANVKKAN